MYCHVSAVARRGAAATLIIQWLGIAIMKDPQQPINFVKPCQIEQYDDKHDDYNHNSNIKMNKNAIYCQLFTASVGIYKIDSLTFCVGCNTVRCSTATYLSVCLFVLPPGMLSIKSSAEILSSSELKGQFDDKLRYCGCDVCLRVFVTRAYHYFM